MAMQIILPGGKVIRRHVRWDSNDGLRGLITLNGRDARVYRESQARNWRLVEEGGPTEPLAAIDRNQQLDEASLPHESTISEEEKLAAWIEEMAKEPLSMRDLCEWSRQNKQKSAQITVTQVQLQCSCGVWCQTEGCSVPVGEAQIVWCNGCGAGWQVEEAVFEPRPYATRPLTYIV